MLEKEELRKAAESAGADIIKVAGIERFAEIVPEKHPAAIFPEVKSVIVIGRRVPRGAIRGVEEGTQFQNYAIYGLDWLENRFLPVTVYAVAEFIENCGWEAVPLQNLPKETPPMGVAVRKGAPRPNVMLDFDDAAVRAGAGEIGYCGMLLTPEFGPRQRVQMILTDAEIEPDGMFDGKICPGSECGGFCPLGALSGEQRVTICGKEMNVAGIDWGKCRRCKNGAASNRHHPSGSPDRLAAACARSCMDFLEEKKILKNTFNSKFRKREMWKLGEDFDLFEK